MTGWWFQLLWKIWKSNGIMTFPKYGKIKFMFQTTNQMMPYEILGLKTLKHALAWPVHLGQGSRTLVVHLRPHAHDFEPQTSCPSRNHWDRHHTKFLWRDSYFPTVNSFQSISSAEALHRKWRKASAAARSNRLRPFGIRALRPVGGWDSWDQPELTTG